MIPLPDSIRIAADVGGTFTDLIALDDLEDRGMPEPVVVLAMGEFGRAPFVNPDLGRENRPNCWPLALGEAESKGDANSMTGRSDKRLAFSHFCLFRERLPG